MSTARVAGERRGRGWLGGRGDTRWRLDAFAWAHPEWWIVLAAAVAWALMIHHGLAHWRHAHHAQMTAPEELSHWLLMVGAMMLPFLVEPLRATAFRSLRTRRHRAMLLFLAGYLAPWTAVGLLAAAVHRLPGAHSHAAAALVFALAAGWTLLPPRRRALVACHRVDPLAASGWRADRDCVRYGASIGAACVTTCWVLMLGCALTGHALPAMLAGAAIAAKERRSFRPPVRSVAAAIALLAAGYGVLAALG